MRKFWANRLTGTAMTLAASTAIFGAQGCLDRPVVPIEPGASSITLTKIRVSKVDKVDLLLVVDNSQSMADKQSELGRRMPELIAALTQNDPKTMKPYVIDIHVGVITSSLGSQGTSICASDMNRANNDRAHLLPRPGEGGGSGWKVGPVAATCPTPVASSTVSWIFDPAADPKATFKGATGAEQLQTATSCVVASAKENGCGYEQTWEAAYHFLVDPAPYLKAEVRCTPGASGDACGNNKIVVEGVDEELLAQRKAFLRPDSLLAVVILSDENDSSLRPSAQNWLPWAFGKGQMQRGWGACAGIPDDFEPETAADFKKQREEYKCWSCFENAADPNCTAKWATDPLNNDVDGRNLRGWAQTQRFGYNFLWGRQRYVDAFKNPQVYGSDNKLAANPIFQGGFRTSDLIVVATIVGVPKALVTDAMTGKPKELTPADWDKIVGTVDKRDPHMIQSIKPRDGVPKFAGDRSIDPMNGGDRDIVDGDDLQYACIDERSDKSKGNDCEGPDAYKKNPLCAMDGTQPYFKAYPGLRHLRIAKDLGISGFVASICNSTYAPAIAGITDKLKAALNSQCVRSSLEQDAKGNVNCLIIEALKEGTVPDGTKCEAIGKGLCTPGAAPCRRDGTNYPPISPEAAAAQLNLPITVVGPDGTGTSKGTQATVENGSVYVIGDDKKKHLVCELEQLQGPAQQSCINDLNFTIASGTGGGWCYSRKTEIVGDQCIKRGAPGTIRFFGGSEPRNGSEVFTYCIGGKSQQ